ncbi:MAG TPA: hypothetical protein VLZ50_01790 [Terracidiphilus sp.]|nr:hypothetical protein [Terracidiphilus sp.]
MQNEDLQLASERVALPGGLLTRDLNADGEIARRCVSGIESSGHRIGGKRKDVCCLVLSAEATIETADGAIGGEKHGHPAAKADCALRLGKKAVQGAGNRQAFGPG